MAESELEDNSEGEKNDMAVGYFQVNPGLWVKTSLLPKPFKIDGFD